MDDFLIQLLGSNTASFYIAGLVFTLLGSLVYKYHAYKKHKQECLAIGDKVIFSRSKWLSENWADVIISLIVSFLAVRFIDITLTLINPKLETLLGFSIPQTEDQIAYFLFVGVLVQYVIHKYYRKPNSKE